MQTTSVTYNHVWLVSRQKSDMTLQLKIVFHFIKQNIKIVKDNILFIRSLFSMESGISGSMKHA